MKLFKRFAGNEVWPKKIYYSIVLTFFHDVIWVSNLVNYETCTSLSKEVLLTDLTGQQGAVAANKARYILPGFVWHAV